MSAVSLEQAWQEVATAAQCRADASRQQRTTALATHAKAMSQLTKDMSLLRISKRLGFLSLPPELRLMVYELISLPVFKYHYQDGIDNKASDYEAKYAIIEKAPACTLFFTCKTIYYEAKPLIERARAALDRAPQIFCRRVPTEDRPNEGMFHAARIIWDISSEIQHGKDNKLLVGRTAALGQSDIGKAFLAQASEAATKGIPFKFGLSLGLGTDMKKFIQSDLCYLIGVLCGDYFFAQTFRGIWFPGNVSNDPFAIKVILAIQGLDITGLELMFQMACRIAGRFGVDIHGVAGTPVVNWKEDWGAADLGALRWPVARVKNWTVKITEEGCVYEWIQE